MNDEERERLERRYWEIEREIEQLYAGKVCDDPIEREAELLLEQDEIEFLFGEEYFRQRDA